MKPVCLFIGCCLAFMTNCKSQDMVAAANTFIRTLDAEKKAALLYPFDIDERYRFEFVPRDDRKGIRINDLSDVQQKAALQLMRTCLSEETIAKVHEIMSLELVLKTLEHRKPDDHYRDPNKYYVAIFGIPGDHTTWGWRLEGHHLSFHFSARDKKLVSGTPGFLGANPALVLDGPQKGKQVLKEEKEMAFSLLNSLSKDELKKAIIDSIAPHEIVTRNDRNVMLKHPVGICYSAMSGSTQQQLLELINLYIHRYTKLFAADMLKEIQTADLNNLWFAWAGRTDPGIGNPHYYRIQGPTILIEYDNTQNNANHIHTVVRDLLHDFGGDQLLEHYRSGH
jgi:hypothetical protein